MAERDGSGEGFLRRWSRLKKAEAEPAAAPAADVPPAAQPTLEDVAALGPDSDYAAFMAHGVDRSLRRLAMKKLFADPHFNTMDGLDIYIGDYTQASPVPAAMLAALDHARGMLARGREVEQADAADADAIAVRAAAGEPETAAAAPLPPSDPADPPDLSKESKA
jgi:hypothetical protein